ncbi:hypothetical protein U1Q18_036613 [Sarracenia purpurea var. burkii]
MAQGSEIRLQKEKTANTHLLVTHPLLDRAAALMEKNTHKLQQPLLKNKKRLSLTLLTASIRAHSTSPPWEKSSPI